MLLKWIMKPLLKEFFRLFSKKESKSWKKKNGKKFTWKNSSNEILIWNKLTKNSDKLQQWKMKSILKKEKQKEPSLTR